jgi:hypothetical protein
MKHSLNGQKLKLLMGLLQQFHVIKFNLKLF